MAWGVSGDRGLAVWTARYNGQSDLTAQPVISWNVPLNLVDLSASPDGQTLAVVASMRPRELDEGLPLPTYLYVVDLTTNAVRSVPDYHNHYDLYARYYEHKSRYIIGWLDNDRFAVQQIGSLSPMLVGRDGASYRELPFQEQRDDTIINSALSPDRKTFFAAFAAKGGADAGLWLFDDKGLIRKLGEATTVRGAVWSPDGRFISYYGPHISGPQEGQTVDYSQSKVWVLDAKTGTQHMISTKDSWDVAPTWSPDSSEIAFLRAEDPTPADRNNHPGNLKTRVYVASVTDLTAHPWTNGASNYNLDVEWTKSGDVVVLSKDSESSDTSSLRVSNNGRESLLLDAPADGILVRLTIFK